jgi:fluoride exporter
MKEIALVFLGGGLGSATRFLIGKAVLSRYTGAFPWATLGVNVLASALLGLTMALYLKKADNPAWLPLLIGTGFCGGLSTFSTFSYENFMLLQKGETTLFLVYTLVSFATCLAGIAGGYYAGRL